jgi:serine/threonine-protein kinase
MIGQLLDHYRIETQLGAGGMGIVYKAYDVRLQRPVAIKLLTHPTDAAQEILCEARAASALNHPHICTIYEVGETAGQAFIVMEYIEGQTLRDVIPPDGLAVDSAVAYAIQIADAVAHAHDDGVIHRDLKSANIVITPEGRTKILDFGLASRFTPSRIDEISEVATLKESDTDRAAGTLAYMPPEVLRGKQPDVRGDIWALGVVLYEMLTSRLPFNGRNNVELSTEILREPPWPLRASIDAGLRGVVTRCLMKEPRQRYQRASEVRSALETIQRELEGSGPLSERLYPVPVTGHRRVTRRMVLMAAAALPALLVFSLAVPQTRRLILPSSWHLQGDGPSAERRAIAVFPFRAIGTDAEAGQLAGGLGEALAARLFQSTALPIASGAAMERAGNGGSTDAAARELGVDVLVRGTVQRIGGTLRIIMNVEDVKNGRSLWAQEISGNSSNLRSLEDRLLAGVLEALDIAPKERVSASPPTANTEAYNLYLKGTNALREQPGAGGAKAAIRFYEEAVRLDAGFGLAYAATSEALLQLFQATRDRQSAERAQYMAERAQQLDPARPEAHLALGAAYNAIGKAPEAIAALKSALALSPNSDKAYRELGRAYASTGRGEEAIQSLHKAVELNAFDPEHYNALGPIANSLGRYAEAAEAFRRLIEFEPDRVRGYSNLGAVYLQTGQFSEAADAFQKALKLEQHPSTYTNLGITYANTGRFAEAVQMLQKAVDLDPNEAHLVNLADGYRWLGQQANAAPIYDKAIALAYQKLRINPQDAATMAALALSYAKKGSASQATQFIAKARSIKPDDLDFIYYEATIHLLADRTAESLALLRNAFQAGYPTAFARWDPDLRVLRSHPSFQDLMKEFAAEPR